MYRTALKIRRDESGLGDGPIEWIDLGKDVLAFSRPGNFLCAVNFGEEVDLPNGEILISSESISNNKLPKDAAIWMRIK